MSHLHWAQIKKVQSKQTRSIHALRGDYYLDHFNITKAVDNYQKSIDNTPNDSYSMLKLAKIYQELGSKNLAIEWHQKAIELDTSVELSSLRAFILLKIEAKKYDEARKWSEVFNRRISKNFTNKNLLADSTIFLIQNIESVNSFNNNINQSLLDKYLPEIISDNEKLISFSFTSNQVFFTKKRLSNKSEKTKAYFFEIDSSATGQVKINELRFRKFKQEIQHLTLNKSGSLLIFSSINKSDNRGFDLYKSSYDQGEWSKPVRMSNINSASNEMHPKLSEDSILYFSSSRQDGLGGLDNYYIDLRKSNSSAIRLESPINSSYDDHGFVSNEKQNTGFFYSNRPDSLAITDMYQWLKLNLPVLPKTKEDSISDLSIYTSSGDQVELFNYLGGDIIFRIIPGINYTLTIQKENYISHKRTSNDMLVGNINLPEGDYFAFYIQKRVEKRDLSDYQKENFKEGEAFTLGYHFNPGDLVTFHLVPNIADPGNIKDYTRILFIDEEINVKSADKLVFGYEVAGRSKKTYSDQFTALENDESNKLANASTDNNKSINSDLEKKPQPDTHESISKSIPNTDIASLNGNSEEANLPLTIRDSEFARIQLDSTISELNLESKLALENKEELGHGIGPGPNPVSNNQELLDKANDSITHSTSKIPNDVQITASLNNEAKKEFMDSTSIVKASKTLGSETTPEDKKSTNSTIAEKVSSQFNNSIRFRVQIAASRSEIGNPELKRIYSGSRGINTFQEGGYFKYYIAEEPEYEIARQILNQCGVKGAFIAAYKDGEKWNLSEAIKFSRKANEL